MALVCSGVMTYARGARSCAVADEVRQTTIKTTAQSLVRAFKQASFTNQFRSRDYTSFGHV